MKLTDEMITLITQTAAATVVEQMEKQRQKEKRRIGDTKTPSCF